MAVGIQPYYTLLQEFIGIASISSETLEKLKEDYRDKIDSTRTLDNICDMKSLIKILDRRDVIRYDNIDELKKIEQNYIKDESVKELISSYEHWLEENIHNISNLYTHGKSSDPKKINSSLENITLARSSIISKAISRCTCEGPGEETQVREKFFVTNEEQENNNHYIFLNLECLRITQKTWALIITSTLLLVMGVIIYNLHAISNSPPALVPRVDDINSAENQNESRTPLHGALSEINVGFTTTATISVSQGHHRTTNSSEDGQRELQELVLKEISKRVGRHWKDISRKLDLQESVLEEIEKKHSDEVMGFQKMFNQAVQTYFEDNPRNWKLQLLQALESARRRDLKEKAQEIIFRYDALHN